MRDRLSPLKTDVVTRVPAEAPTEVSPLRITNFVLRNRRNIIGIPMIVGVVIGILNMFTHRSWMSSASFMPQAQSKNAGAKIAQEFGVDLGGGDDAQNSPMFYVSLLGSKPMLSSAVLNKYHFVS